MCKKISKKRLNILCLLLIFSFVLSMVGCQSKVDDELSEVSETETVNKEIVTNKAVSMGELSTETVENDEVTIEIVGMEAAGVSEKAIIIPHHLVAEKLITKGFESMVASYGGTKPDLVVLLSPNHATQISQPIMAPSLDPTQNEPTDVQSLLIEELIEAAYIPDPTGPMANEHGIYNIVPYIETYFDQTPIIALAFARNADPAIGEAIMDRIVSISEQQGLKDILWVLSTDFSHGLRPLHSEERDGVILDIIHTKTYERFIDLDTEYTDAPVPLYLLFNHLVDKNEPELIAHENSGLILGNLNITDTTSYFVYLWH